MVTRTGAITSEMLMRVFFASKRVLESTSTTFGKHTGIFGTSVAESGAADPLLVSQKILEEIGRVCCLGYGVSTYPREIGWLRCGDRDFNPCWFDRGRFGGPMSCDGSLGGH